MKMRLSCKVSLARKKWVSLRTEFLWCSTFSVIWTKITNSSTTLKRTTFAALPLCSKNKKDITFSGTFTKTVCGSCTNSWKELTLKTFQIYSGSIYPSNKSHTKYASYLRESPLFNKSSTSTQGLKILLIIKEF